MIYWQLNLLDDSVSIDNEPPSVVQAIHQDEPADDAEAHSLKFSELCRQGLLPSRQPVWGREKKRPEVLAVVVECPRIVEADLHRRDCVIPHAQLLLCCRQLTGVFLRS